MYISQEGNEQLVICKRLREERERLGLTQKEVAEHVGMTQRVQVMYESGKRNPDSRYLAAIALRGFDVLYILTGQRSQPVAPQELLPEGDRIFLDNLHAAPAEVQRGVKITLDAFAPRGAASAGTHHRSHRKSA